MEQVARMERREGVIPDFAEFTIGRTEGVTRELHRGYLLGKQRVELDPSI
jgi:hypothetical protein